jgi:hypothetical protein
MMKIKIVETTEEVEIVFIIIYLCKKKTIFQTTRTK